MMRDRREYHRQYNRDNKERIRKQKKQYYEDNREHKIEWSKQYYLDNKKRIDERQKQYGETHREHKKEYHKKWFPEYYIKNREEILRKAKEHYENGGKERRKEYYRKTSEIRRKYENTWAKTEKGKVKNQKSNSMRRTRERKIINTLTAQEWIDILKKYKFRCAYCGKEFTLFDRETRDHVIPISKGGDNVKENIVPACQSCNSKKHNKILRG